ncbi:hypothetical protein [Thermus filiformis]|uniref:hypothetical protein n=1 Tax=Thermus filiformis TaxID=276 RepID=UPI000AC48AD2|nr:hypothetical protein [Thermus filiformis]
MAQKAGVGYLVFARKEYAEPLRFQGEWVGLAETEAVFQRFGQDWLEVVLVPERAVRWVIRSPEREETHA